MQDKNDSLLANVYTAFQGRFLWKNIVRRYKIDNKKYVILLPSFDKDYNYLSLLYLDRFLIQRKTEGAVILTKDERVLNAARLFTDKVIAIELLPDSKIKHLLKFYCLYEFTDRLIVASLEEPEGRTGRNIVGKKGLTLEEVFGVVVFGITEFEGIEPPRYTGNEENIKDFFARK